MLKTRRCDICKTRLFGKKGHGFVTANGKSLICGDYKRHARLKKGKKFHYGYEEETQEASEAEAQVLTHD